MQWPSRRQLLASTGSVLIAGSAGCLGFGSERDLDGETNGNGEENGARNGQEERPWHTAFEIPNGLATALGYVFESTGSDENESPESTENEVMLHIANIRQQGTGESLGLFRPSEDVLVDFEPVAAETETDWGVTLTSLDGSTISRVWTGDIVVDKRAAVAERHGFGIYEGDPWWLATDGDVGLLGEEEWLERTLDRKADDEEPLPVSRQPVGRIIEALSPAADTLIFDDRQFLEQQFFQHQEGIAVPEVVAVTVRNASESDESLQQREYTVIGWYRERAEEAAADALETLGEQFSQGESETVERTIDGQFVTVELVSQFLPYEARPEIPASPQFAGYDEGDVLFRFETGDEIRVEYLDLELGAEPYPGEWARGQQTVGEGDTVAIDADAIEPGDELRLVYESPELDITDSWSRGVLIELPFEYLYDPFDETLELRYVDGPSLSADRLSVRITLEEFPLVDQLEGDLSVGDTLLFEDVSHDDLGRAFDAFVGVEYERSDTETVSLSAFELSPPGLFAFERDSGDDSVTVVYDTDVVPEPTWVTLSRGDETALRTRPAPEPLEPVHYEVRLDGTPADTQWADHGDTVEEGDELVLEGVELGTEIEVLWTGTDEETRLGRHIVRPQTTFEVEYIESAELLRVSHTGGDSVDADQLEIQVSGPDDERTSTWPGSTAEEGDSVLLLDIGEETVVQLSFEGDPLAETHVWELLDEDGPVEATPPQPHGSDDIRFEDHTGIPYGTIDHGHGSDDIRYEGTASDR